MLFLHLVSHNWKRALRSAARGQQTGGNVAVLILVLLFALNLLGLGLYLHALLKKLEPGVDPVEVFNGWVLYYLGIDLLFRQVLQRIPGQAIVPYLTLPVKKSTLVHLLLFRTFFSFFNLLPWILITPFAVNAIMPGFGIAGTLGWLGALGFLVAANSLLNVLVRKLAFTSWRTTLLFGGVIVLIFALDLCHVISLAQLSRYILASVLDLPTLSLVLLPVPVVLYVVLFVLLGNRMYLEDLTPTGALRGEVSSGYRFLETAGARGTFIALELKLFLRNRRARASLITSLTVLPLGILFYGMILRAEGDPYPIPSGATISDAQSMEQVDAPPGYRRVTFSVAKGVVPPFAHAYITGDNPTLAKWRPDAMPLLRNPDSSWSRSFLFEDGTNLRYCFTLGNWQTEEKVGDGSNPPVHTMTVRSDTCVLRTAISWKTPEFPLIVKINLLYWGLLVTGILMFAYGQFFLAWNSTFFDALMTWHIRFRWLLETKTIVLFAAGTISFVLTIPYVLMDARILLYNTLAFVYNLGVNSYLLLYLASLSKKRFELNESIFSQQGKGAAQFIAILPMWILPVALYGVLEGVGVPYALILLFGGAGVVGILLKRPLLTWMFARMESRKYEIAVGFREGGTL